MGKCDIRNKHMYTHTQIYTQTYVCISSKCREIHLGSNHMKYTLKFPVEHKFSMSQ